jgi:CheY-like chemotaxis protein
MRQPSAWVPSGNTDQQTRSILIIDDNGQLRASLARYIMLSCHAQRKSCAIYRIGERAEPLLNYFSNPANESEFEPTTAPDFAVFETATPRQALNWISQSGLRCLTIISDVMMPVDTEVGLPGMLSALSDLQIGVNLVFMSSEPQNIEHVQNMLQGQQAYFLIKGSESWNKLPDALIKSAHRFVYRVVPKLDYSNSAIFKPAPMPGQGQDISSLFKTPEPEPRLVTAPTWGGKVLTTRRPTAVVATNTVQTVSEDKPGFWSRLFGFFRRS